MPPLLSAPLFKRWERGDEVTHSLKIACKTSCSVGPCADSSAPVPGSLCEKPPPSPPGRGERDGAGWQCLGAALPEHDVAPGGYTSPCSSALAPGPAARNRIWEGLSKACWLRELRSCSFSPLLPGARVPSVCTHPVLCPRMVLCRGWAQQQGEEGAWMSSVRAVPGGSQLGSVSCRAQSGLLPCCWKHRLSQPLFLAAERNPDTQCPASFLSSPAVPGATGSVLCTLQITSLCRVSRNPCPEQDEWDLLQIHSADAPGEVCTGCEEKELRGAAGAGSAGPNPKPVAEPGLTPGAPRAEPDPLRAHLPCRGIYESVVQLSQESTACTNIAETPVSQPALALSTLRILLGEEKHLFFRWIFVKTSSGANSLERADARASI